MDNYPNPQSIFNSELEYVTKTSGWTNILLPYWNRVIQRQECIVRAEERKLSDNKSNRVQYELGQLDGMKKIVNSIESIKKGIRLRQGISRSPAG